MSSPSSGLPDHCCSIGSFYINPRYYLQIAENLDTIALVVKNLPANAGDVREVSLITVSGRSPGGGHSSPLQYPCLENPTDRGAWWGPWGHKELDTTEVTYHTCHFFEFFV